MPVQELQLTAVHPRGTPAQPAYPALHLGSTTRATREYPNTGQGLEARPEHSNLHKQNTKEIHPVNHYHRQGCSLTQACTLADTRCPRTIPVLQYRYRKNGD